MNPLLTIPDELTLYLVASGIRPAGTVTLKREKYEQAERSLPGITLATIRPRRQDLEAFNKLLDDAGVEYHLSTARSSAALCRKYLRIPKRIETQLFPLAAIGRDRQSLERVLCAGSDLERGIAFGYPEGAARAYLATVEGERRDDHAVRVALARARAAGISPPPWLAYIHFIPEYLDLVNGHIPPESERIGTKHMEFVRRGRPRLAERVEQHFLGAALPDSWQLHADGSHTLTYPAAERRI